MLRDSQKLVTTQTTITQSIDTLKKVGPPLEVASPWILFGGIFLVASVGGIAALMKGKQKITGRMVFSAAILNGLASVAIALLLYDKMPLGYVLGTSIFSGIGGITVLDATIQAMRPKFGDIGVAVLTAMLKAFTSKKDEDK